MISSERLAIRRHFRDRGRNLVVLVIRQVSLHGFAGRLMCMRLWIARVRRRGLLL
jgi:hypothetical protein